MSAELAGIARVFPPHGNGTGDREAGKTASISSTSTTATSLGLSTGAGRGRQYVSMICTEAFHIRFGASDVGAATTSDMLIPANTTVMFACNPVSETHFRAIRASADGTLHYYISGE